MNNNIAIFNINVFRKLRIILLAMGTSIASSTGSELIKVGGVESMNKSF